MQWNQRSATSETTRSSPSPPSAAVITSVGLLADLAADHRLAALEEGRDVGALGALGLARLDHALDHLEGGGPGAPGAAASRRRTDA